MKKIFFFALFYLAVAKTEAQTGNNKKPKPHGTMLITLKISKAGEDYNVSIINITTVAGYKKTIPEKTSISSKDDLVCFILNKNKKVIDTLGIRLSFETRYEYPGENGTINSKIVELKEKEILLRYPNDPDIKYLQMIKPGTGNNLRMLTTLELPEMNGLNQ